MIMRASNILMYNLFVYIYREIGRSKFKKKKKKESLYNSISCTKKNDLSSNQKLQYKFPQVIF